MFGDIALSLVALLLIAAFAAGWIDAVVGGGGLLQLPVLILVPGLAPVEALGTNKLAAIFGTATSAITWTRRVPPHIGTVLPMALIAFIGSYCGAQIAAYLSASAIKPIIIIALICVAVLTLTRPTMGSTSTQTSASGLAQASISAALGAVIGFYDGLLGPGTGTFLILALITINGYDFLTASSTAKIVNVATNLGALALFAPQGHLVWGVGLAMGAANMAGGYLGSRTAIAKGNKFIRVIFLLVVTALIFTIGHSV